MMGGLSIYAVPLDRLRNAVVGIAVLVTMLAIGVPTSANASDAELVAEVREKLVEVFNALATGDPAKVAPLLAPEFQVVRSDGGGYGKEDYLAQSIPKIQGDPVFRDLIVTRNGDIVVVRLVLEIDEVIDGKQGSAQSPQLIVFRAGSTGWQVIAAGNFAKLQ